MPAQSIIESTVYMAIRNKRDESFIKSVNEIIEANLSNEGFGVSELADKMSMSRSSLHRKIRVEAGTTVSYFIRNARLQKAYALLKEHSITVAETAYKTGFRSASHFSKCFKNHFGYPPVEVRKGTFDEEEDNPQNNFPVFSTSFIGRKKEIEAILILTEKHRIVTLTGSGGCGKTRLACEVVKRIQKDYKDGIWFVDLSSIEMEELVIKQVMTALRISEIPGQDRLETVAEKIRDQKLLIVLDNCEHLLRTCAGIAHKLIGSVPGLSLLVTSREALNIRGEKIWTIPSLSLPDPSSIINLAIAEKSEAVNMFADRARLSNPGFELVKDNATTVVTICQMVDGIPLAIELVSNRIRHMAAPTLLRRLSEKFDSLTSHDPGTSERRRTIQATIEWSYNLLLEEEKALFRQLNVFSGGFDLNAAEEVCTNQSLPKERILDILSQLVDKSMIQIVYQPGQEMRYRLLETLQRHASKKALEKDGDGEAHRRHLEYFTRMAEEAYLDQFESSAHWLPKLKLEYDNLISALNWADQNRPEGFRILAAYLPWFWVFNSLCLTGKQYLEKAYSQNSEESEVQARVLYGLGYLTHYFQDPERVIKLLNESMALWQKYDNPFEEAVVTSILSLTCQQIKDFKLSFKYSARSLDMAREVGKPGLINNALIYLGIAMVHSKQFTYAIPYLDELLASSVTLNHALGISAAHHLRSDCALGLKDFPGAEKTYGMGIQSAMKHNILFNAYADLQGLAFALSGQSRWAKSLRLNAMAVHMFKATGIEIYGIWPLWDEFTDTYIGGARKTVGEEMAKQYEEEGIAMGFDRAVEYALDFTVD